MCQARERDIVRLVHLDTLGRKYREAWGDIDPEDLKKRLGADLGQLHREGGARIQTEEERMRLQAMEARAMSAEAGLAALKHELAQAQTKALLWRNQVDVQKELTAAETAKLEALRVSSARKIEEYARWGLLAGEYEARTEAAEAASGALSAEATALRAELEARDKVIAALRAGCEGVLRAEYEERLKSERTKWNDKAEKTVADLKGRLAHATREKEGEMKQRQLVEAENRKLKALVEQFRKQMQP